MRFNFIVFKRMCSSRHACHWRGMQPLIGFLPLGEEVLVSSSAPVFFFYCLSMVCEVMESHYTDSRRQRKSRKGQEPVEGRGCYMMLSFQI